MNAPDQMSPDWSGQQVESPLGQFFAQEFPEDLPPWAAPKARSLELRRSFAGAQIVFFAALVASIVLVAWLTWQTIGERYLAGSAQTTEFQDGFVDKSPHQSAFITVHGIKLHYLDWGGTGRPLLFLTGLGHSAHIYDDLAPKFVDEFRVLALTRRGHGQSDTPETGYDVDTLTEDVRQFLDAMKIDRVTLVGHSMAGGELTRFAGLHPERVDRLVYLDAAYDRTDPSIKASREKSLAVVPMPNPAPEDRASIDAMRNHSKKVRGGWSDAMEADWRERNRLFSPAGQPPKSMDLAKVVEGYRPPDYTKVKAPALGIYAVPTIECAFPWLTPDAGAEVRKQAQELLDTDILPRQRRNIEQFRKEMTNARVIELPGTRHDCFIHKQDEVVREMRAFLSGK